MKRASNNQKLAHGVLKRQKEDTGVSNKMEKNTSSQLCDYEKAKMARVQSNAARMKALGVDSLVNKLLLDKYAKIANGVVDEITRDDQELQHKVSKNLKPSKSKKDKQPLLQTLPMAEFSVSRERQQKSKEIQQNQPPILIQQPSSGMSSAPSEAQVQNLVKAPQYCAPGSMKKFASMRRNQVSKGQQLTSTSASLPSAEEQHGPRQFTVEGDLNEINDLEELILNRVELESAPDIIQDESNEDLVTKEKKHRGKTIMAHVHARTMDKRSPVVFNNLGQLVGPTEEVVLEFNHFLGTLAKDSNYAPLNFVSWKYMPLKDKIWEYVQKKFIVEDDAKRYVMKSVNAKWRLHKTRMKEKYYKKDETMDQRMEKRPIDIPEEEFMELMIYWDTEKSKDISKKNKENRGKQWDMHTLGPKSFALLRDELKQSDPNNEDPSQADLYIKSRERKPGRAYLTPNEETLENIAKMRALKANEEGSTPVDPYYDVMTKKEHNGRLRTYGLGVTKSSLKKKDPNVPYKIPSVFTQHIEKTMAEEMEKKVAEQVKKAVAEQMEETLSYVMSKILEANRGRDIHIPDFTTIQDLSSSHANSIGDHDDDLDVTSALPGF